jgi:hypothetical protein
MGNFKTLHLALKGLLNVGATVTARPCHHDISLTC